TGVPVLALAGIRGEWRAAQYTISGDPVVRPAEPCFHAGRAGYALRCRELPGNFSGGGDHPQQPTAQPQPPPPLTTPHPHTHTAPRTPPRRPPPPGPVKPTALPSPHAH